MEVIKLFILFLFGCFLGWLLELFYRNVVTKEKINPGFLKGPYLPIYGLSVLFLYLISELQISLGYKIAIFIIFPTLAELATVIIFEKYFKIRLWNYDNDFLNYKGIICPLYSFYWAILTLIYYFVLHDLLKNHLLSILSNLNYVFFYGMIAGIFILDLSYSFNIAFRIRKTVKELRQKRIDFHKFKISTKVFESFKKRIPKLHKNKD